MVRLSHGAALLAALAILGAATPGNQQPAGNSIAFPPVPPRVRGFGPPEIHSSAPRVLGELDAAAPSPQPRLLSVERIWDKASHNAFTDLTRFRERWYCAFREGSAHVSPDGAIRVISSADGSDWASAFHIASEYADLRDPKLDITPDRRLMLSAVAAYNPPARIGHQTLAWFTLDGRNWGIPFKIGDPEMWLWRVAWHRDNAYSMAYSTGEKHLLRMYVGPQGLRFRSVADEVLAEDKPTEATLLFDNDDSALCLLRRDGGSGAAHLGYSRPPYRAWQWRDLGLRLGGPNMIRLPDGRIVAAGRLYDPRQRTSLCWLDPREATLTEFLTLPSGGDNSYPGLVFYNGVLWISYYSSHEDHAAIYLAKVQLPEPEEKSNEKPKIAF